MRARRELIVGVLPPLFGSMANGSVRAPAGAHEPDLQLRGVLIGQLERLGKPRDSGILTEDEFQEQNTALLRATPDPRPTAIAPSLLARQGSGSELGDERHP